MDTDFFNTWGEAEVLAHPEYSAGQVDILWVIEMNVGGWDDGGTGICN